MCEPLYFSTCYKLWNNSETICFMFLFRHLRSARRGELDFPVSIWPRTGDGRLPTPMPTHLGTLYLAVSRTLILLCKHLNAISRPSYFPHTSTFSAFEVFTKTRYINPLLLLLLLLLLLFYFTCASAWNKTFYFSFISVLFYVVRAALVVVS